MKNITQSLKVISLALLLSIGISYVSAWTAPTVTPPNGNVAAPINVGSTAQTKSGGMNVMGNVGIGTTNTTQKLDVLGGNIAARVTDSTSRVGFVAQSSYGQSVIFSGGGHGSGMGFYTDSTSAAGPTDAKMVIQTGTGNVGIGTANPQGKLDVAGDVRAGNSDIYFTKTDHNHTGTGNTPGYAAIENTSNYNTLMILGRMGGIGGGRSVSIWDRLDVNGSLYVNGVQVTGGAPQYQYGGVYARDYCGSQGNSPNPYTGGYSCPSGFAAQSPAPYVHEGSICVQFFFCYR